MYIINLIEIELQLDIKNIQQDVKSIYFSVGWASFQSHQVCCEHTRRHEPCSQPHIAHGGVDMTGVFEMV